MEINFRLWRILFLGVVEDFAFWKCLGVEAISNDLVHIKSKNIRTCGTDGDAANGFYVGLHVRTLRANF